MNKEVLIVIWSFWLGIVIMACSEFLDYTDWSFNKKFSFSLAVITMLGLIIPTVIVLIFR